MTTDLLASRPLVTVFGDHDALDVALNDELERRGRITHTISTPLGWLKSVTHAVIRLNTPTGVQALRDLASRDVPQAQVVAVCETSMDDAMSERVADLCRQCGETHDITLIWHAPFEPRVADAHHPDDVGSAPSPGELAVTIADEVRSQEGRVLTATFASQNFEPRGRGATP